MASHLIRRGNNYYVRVAVPRPLRALVGRAEFQRTTGTSSLREAERLKHAIISEIHEEIDLMVDNDPASPSWLEHQALALRRSVQRGELNRNLAVEIISDLKDKHLAAAKLKDEELDDDDPRVEHISRLHRLASDPNFKPFSQLVDEYLDERASSVTKSTLGAMRRTIDAFSNWLPGDPPISEITRRDTGRYVSEIMMNNGKAPKTNRDTMTFLTGMFNWSIRRGLYDRANPWSDLGKDLKGSRRGGPIRERRAWTPEEVGKLALLPTDDPMHPLCMIALYSGMRLNEIAELRLKDVKMDAGMFVVREGKTESSVRQVPIHPDIRDLVARWHEQSTDGYLIAGLQPGGEDDKRGHSVSKRIGRWIRKNVSTDPGVVFHSLRNTFMTRAERADIPESTVKLIVGHKRQSLTYGLYSKGPGFDRLVEAFGQIIYPEFDL